MAVGSAHSTKTGQQWLGGGAQVAENITGDYSIGCWFKMDAGIANNTGGFSIGGDNSSSGGGLSRAGSFQFWTSGGVGYKLRYRSEESTSGDITDPSAYTAATWVFGVATRNASTRVVTLYTNGQPVATYTPASNYDFTNGNGFGGSGWPVILAYDQNNNASGQILGNITACWCMKRCLTAAEVLQMYNCQMQPDSPVLAVGTDLLAYWKLNSPTTGNITDGDAGLVDHGTCGSTLTVKTGTPTWTTATPFSAPTVDAGGPYSTCGTTPVSISGASSTPCNNGEILWSTSGTGTFNSATVISPTYTPSAADVTAGSVTLTIQVTGSGDPTVVTDTATLTVYTPPTASAGGPYSITSGSTVVLSAATAGNSTSIAWTTAGDGTFNDNTLIQTTYTPGSDDIENGSVVLTLTVNGSGPCSAATSQATINISTNTAIVVPYVTILASLEFAKERIRERFYVRAQNNLGSGALAKQELDLSGTTPVSIMQDQIVMPGYLIGRNADRTHTIVLNLSGGSAFAHIRPLSPFLIPLSSGAVVQASVYVGGTAKLEYLLTTA